jgi:hypothetical protein
MLSLLLLVTVPVQASPIKFVDVLNVMGDLQNGGQLQQLRLRAAAQDPSIAPSGASSGVSEAVTPAIDPQLPSSVASTSEVAAPALMAGTAVAAQMPQSDVQVFQQDSVDGTICDCGEIPEVGGGIPWWPFLALIPLVCVTGVCSHDDNRTPPPPDLPTPTPTPPIPEPTSLLLFGSGIVALTAGARRRYAKMRANKEAAAVTEV